MRIDSTGALIAKPTAGTGAVFNEDGVDADFRVESDTNTHALFVEGSSGNVGIGTSSPGDILHISGTNNVVRIEASTTGTNTIQMGDTASSGAGYIQYANNGDYMRFATNASERMRIDSSGNVGIGTSSPVSRLHVSYDSSGLAPRVAGTTNGRLDLEDLAVADGSRPFQYLQSDDGSLIFGNANRSGTSTTGSVERMRITSAGNVSIGGTADRATTVGTKALNIFDGTAPVGTLTNGISLYSSSGEAYVMDAAGNATLFSPHDTETNEWIFHSKHTPSGKVLRIDVERLLRFVNDHFGLDAVKEFVEE
jgi:hypothetical protein